MKDDAAFFKMVLANPGDEATRLVYADWLEEQGDPRGEILRLDAALVRLPGADKAYVKSRERWLELRGAVEDSWAKPLSYRPIVSLEGLIHFLREFHRGWMEDAALRTRPRSTLPSSR